MVILSRRQPPEPALTNAAATIAAIQAHDAGHDRARLALKYAAMREGLPAFFRATCHLFYAHLPKLGGLLDAPKAWCCGDLHMANFGSFKSGSGATAFDINDFDEALLAPCIWDALRVCASIALAASAAGGQTRLMRLLIATYADTLAAGRIGAIEPDSATGIVGELMDRLKGQSRGDFLDKRTKKKGDSRVIMIDSDHALQASPAEKTRMARLVEQWGRVQPDSNRLADGFFDVADVARRIAGLGSLGIERYVVLVKGKGGPDRMRLLDVKLARPSTSVAASRTAQPVWPNEACRVTGVQTFMQAQVPAWLGTLADGERSYVVRELQPREDRLNLAKLAGDDKRLAVAIASFARLLAWGQLRASARDGAAAAEVLMGFGQKDAWREPLLQAAGQCAAQCQDDWSDFCKFYDTGAFSFGSSATQ